MTFALYDFVDLYRRQLDTLAHLVEKAAATAAERGIGEAEVLGWRLVDDMNPLSFQFAVAITFAQGWPARVAGETPPESISAELDLAGYRAAIASAKERLAALTPEQFAGRDDAPITFKIGDFMEPTLPAARWLANFATTNLYFHVSIAYAILRAHGVDLGKRDMFTSGL